MRESVLSELRSPVTGGLLQIEVFQNSKDGQRIENARLIDCETGEWFRLEEGIAELVPGEYQNKQKRAAFAARYNLDKSAPNPNEAVAHNLAIEQIEFFSLHRDRYEDDVVRSPFYDVFDAVNLGTWLAKQNLAGNKVLEVGAGTGRQTLSLAAQGAEVLACDLSEDMLLLAKHKAEAAGLRDKIDFVVAIAEKLPLASGTYEAGVIFGSMHHFMKPLDSLLEMGRVLRTGAPFYLLEPHASPVRFAFDWLMLKWKLWDEEAAEDPLFRKRQFQDWLKKAGFQSSVGYSTYLPPHLFYLLPGALGRAVLASTDALFSSIPAVKTLAGVITAQSIKN